MRVQGCPTLVRNESDSGWNFAQSTGLNPLGEWSECEHVCWDPKDGELCLSRAKPWWRLVAILTCKSIVKFGYRGERLIEPY